MKRLSKIDLGQLLLTFLMFSVIVDPTNTIFGIKEIAFGLVILSFFFRRFVIYKDALYIIVISFLVLIVSSLSGHFFGFEFKQELERGYYKAFVFLLILILTKDKHYNFMKAIIPSAIIISVITIYLYIVFLYNLKYSTEIYQYLRSHDDFVIVGDRTFFNFNILSIYYKSSPLLVITLCYSYIIFIKKRSMQHLFYLLLFFITLIMSGTRANILSAVLVVFFIPIWYKIKNKLFIIMVAVCCIFVAALYLLGDKKESSLKTKNEVLYNTIEHIKHNKKIILFGQGCGSTFYGSKERGIIGNTELTYLEVFRMFGGFGALIIFFIFVLPLLLMFRLKPRYYMSFSIGYLAYLFIGGTNPLLISSTGFTVLAVAYSFAFGNSKLSIAK